MTRHDSHPSGCTPLTLLAPGGVAPNSPVPRGWAPGPPVLAVTRMGLRRAGLVVLDRTRCVRYARVLDLKRHRLRSERLEALRSRVGRLSRRHGVGLITLQAPTSRSPTPPGLRDVLQQVAGEQDAWLQERSVEKALRTIAHDGAESTALVELAAEYRQLAVRLDLERSSFFRSRSHESDVRPLINAFVLAHAASLEASRGAPGRAG
jgi:hypothetical protein